jgi:arginyl-tRNA synthetase
VLYPLSYEGGVVGECTEGATARLRGIARSNGAGCPILPGYDPVHMTIFPAAIRRAVSYALAAAAGDGAMPVLGYVDFVVERPRDRANGDWATNVALVTAKAAGMPPRAVADLVVSHFPEVEYLRSVEVAGPGFINIRLTPSWYHEVVRVAATQGPGFARSDMGAKERIQVEFVSSNPNGPLHFGHGRGGVIGDVLIRMLEYIGHPVEREYYYNDAGAQIDRFAASLEARYLEALGRESEFPEDGYHGQYVVDWAGELAAEQGFAYLDLPEEQRRSSIRTWGLARAMRDIEETLEMARIPFDRWFSETSLHESGAVDRSIEVLREAGHVYEADGATWFRTTAFGDDQDRVIIKSDGTYTYIAPDVAYHRDKFERGFDRVINIWGADHHGYIPRMKAAVAALGYRPDRLEILINQMVNVSRGGEPVRMSTRAGDFITFREVLEEVGTDATRYHLAAFSPDTTMTFDLDAVRAQSMDNPVYYLQYAHARMCSLERFAAEEKITRLPIDEVDLAVLVDPAETGLMKQIDRLGEEVAEAAKRRAPHRLCAYGYDLATAFHRFYTDCRVVTDDPAVTQARLWLVEASKSAIRAVLDLLAITAPESM